MHTHKKISLFQLVMLALGSLIGSGWLFGSWEAAKLAGPAAILSWIIGGLIIGSIAYNYIEIGTMFPESGGMSKYAQYSHGSFLGFIAAWANWVSLITIIPIEAVATVQYMSSWPWAWARWTHGFLSHGTITTAGLFVVFLIIIIFTLLNYWSVAILTHFTSLISIFKIGMPLLTVILLTASGFHPANYGTSWHSFFPYGTAPVLTATSVAGIIFSFDAFQTAINMGSEIAHPKRNIGLGITLSLLISGVIYILLQSTFITTMPAASLAHGWHGLNFTSPFADLAILLGIHWLSVLLYMDAFVSPFGTGVSFVASTARALYAMAGNRHLPKALGQLNLKYGTPRIAMVVSAVLSMVMVSLFRSWSLLATVLSTATLVAYLTGPVTAVSLRHIGQNLIRPIRLKHLHVIAPISFILASLAIYWAMWPTTIQVIGIILLGLPIYLYYEWRMQFAETKQAFRASWWLIGYLVFITVMSYIGGQPFNGRNWIHYPWDQLVIAIVSYGFYRWGVRSAIITADFKKAQVLNQQTSGKLEDD
ncbi:APC family permease [Loigolactobacillus bifermentans]|uniref:Amino acid permease n=1 Tax=Loigolactobacillus bifermentans DSM 20003 TaxID=1423726 RepID=A0A0R1GEJ5_9LACO|nr:APC family permease [Loigolactobacillus bifermentans]KRK32504.1 amino acid permease [Loigolactobacillus bifermentans DSM 20003]QGG60181.1 amino acid permease [Loigolactobacillus bifermentans]